MASLIAIFLLSLSAKSATASQQSSICSEAGKTIVLKLGAEKKLLADFCMEPKTNTADYDLENGTSDFSQIRLDLAEGKAQGRTVRLVIKGLCRTPDVFQNDKKTKNFPTVSCVEKNGSSFLATAPMEIRKMLMGDEAKGYELRELLRPLNGVVVDTSATIANIPIIEIK